MHKALSPISPMFSIAAAFGNVHGVYKSGNVVLSPHLLKGHQEYAKQQFKYAILYSVSFSHIFVPSTRINKCKSLKWERGNYDYFTIIHWI